MVIEIAGQQWSVMKVDSHHAGLYVEGETCRGTAWSGNAEIYLSNELKGDQVMRVIMHELTHAYIYSTQANVPESWSEESVCELFAIYGSDIVVLAQAIHKSLYPEVKLRPYHESCTEVRV